jgi:lipoprotein-anchoring transpeptidase ErfK/SrfK
MRRRLALTAALAGTLAFGALVGPTVPAGAGGAFQVRAVGGARALGAPGRALNAPLVGIAATPRGNGYWLLARDGGIFSYGGARFYGSTGNLRLNQPVVGIAATPKGRGYWLVASDGGIFTFGGARFYGSTGNRRLNSPIVGMAATRSGRGYWLVAANGAVYTTGAARYSGGAAGGLVRAAGIARAAHGYWVATGPSGPALPPNSGTGRRIVYSNAQQRIWLVEANGLVSHTFLVSGRHGLPAVGVHHVFMKVPTSPSGNLTLPWTLKFAWSTSGNPIDIHGIPLRPDGSPIEADSQLGTPLSHGCLRMKQSEAKFVWDWASVGTTVVVTDLGW